MVPWRMLGFLLVLGLLAGFAAVNGEHRADVSFGFFEFTALPIFLSLLLAFIAGALFVMPLALRRGRRMRDAELAGAPGEHQVRAALSARSKPRGRASRAVAGDVTDLALAGSAVTDFDADADADADTVDRSGDADRGPQVKRGSTAKRGSKADHGSDPGRGTNGESAGERSRDVVPATSPAAGKRARAPKKKKAAP
jgi:uncharacterized integral membrane protein